MLNTVKLPALGIVLVAMSACSTITSGTEQTVMVTTEPPEAQCQLERGGHTIGVVNPTPNSVRISKSHSTISVQCSKDGYEDGEAALEAGFQPMTLGNILIGGVVGVGVDALSGASAIYPESIMVPLTPIETPELVAPAETDDTAPMS